jgi:hypothetical protein
MCHERTERSHTPGATLHGSGDVVPHRNENGVPRSVARHEAVEFRRANLARRVSFVDVSIILARVLPLTS